MQIAGIKGDLNLPEEVFDGSNRPSFRSIQKTHLLLFLTRLDRSKKGNKGICLQNIEELK